MPHPWKKQKDTDTVGFEPMTDDLQQSIYRSDLSLKLNDYRDNVIDDIHMRDAGGVS